MAFFVEAVLFIFKKEENKIPAIQQMVWAKSDSEVLSGSSTKHCYWSLLVPIGDSESNWATKYHLKCHLQYSFQDHPHTSDWQYTLGNEKQQGRITLSDR